MAYKINRTGANVSELLDQVENKTIYPAASQSNDGLMSKKDKVKLDEMAEAVPMTNLEIENILN